MILRPMFSYFGAKWSVAKYLPSPRPGSVIVEPFAGSAGYALRYGAGREVLLVDLDPVVVSVWNYLISAHPDELRQLPDIDPDATIDDYELSQPQKNLIGFWLNKGTTHPAKRVGAWARNFPERKGWGQKTRDRLADQVPYLRRWRVIHGDYTLADIGPADYHVDPPYQKAGSRYRCGSKDFCFASLAAWCSQLRGRVHICEAAGANWLPFEPFRKTKATTKKGGRYSHEVLFVFGATQGTQFELFGQASEDVARPTIRWRHSGERCRARGCRNIMTETVCQGELFTEGPQGGWVCADGHSGWIWPRQCAILEGCPPITMGPSLP